MANEIVIDRYDEKALREMGCDVTRADLLAEYAKIRNAWDRGYKGQLPLPTLLDLAANFPVLPDKTETKKNAKQELVGAK